MGGKEMKPGCRVAGIAQAEVRWQEDTVCLCIACRFTGEAKRMLGDDAGKAISS